ncbi:MAG: NAD-dependent epimerase/dehydratase family protein [Candidatus Gastranaerophilales bacterium]|nr:NAD-dependent epimerase/dehydratase family protein [Candidatus Gastranaerophilales bacterium]
MQKNILILGGQGFIGYNLTLRCLKDGDKVTVFERKINPERKIDGVNYVEGDFCNIQDYANIFENIDIVYHLISTSKPNNDRDKIEFDISSNVIGTIRMLNVCLDKKVKKVVYISSGGTVYGESRDLPSTEESQTNPICAYGIDKLAIEKYLFMYRKIYGLDYAIIRLSNPYGPNHTGAIHGVINVFLDKISKGEDLEVWGDGEIARDYIYIDDVIEALIKITDNELKMCNISSGKVASINEIIDILKEVSGKKFKVDYKDSRNIDILINYLDNTLARNGLNWSPKVGLKEGIKRTYESLIQKEPTNAF